MKFCSTLFLFVMCFSFDVSGRCSSESKKSIASSTEFIKVSDIPLIYECDGFLSDVECDHLIAIAAPELMRSGVVDPNSANSLIDSRRTSLGMFVSSATKDKVVRKIYKRIAQATKIPEKNGESAQILYYQVGAEYRPHYDYFDPSTTGGLTHLARGGQRIATFLVYLNTVEEGGETIFPRAQVKIIPEKGKALLFYNVNASGVPDPMSFHGGAPVTKGEKWLISRWLREGEFN